LIAAVGGAEPVAGLGSFLEPRMSTITSSASASLLAREDQRRRDSRGLNSPTSAEGAVPPEASLVVVGVKSRH
jgi:hypothetical protein